MMKIQLAALGAALVVGLGSTAAAQSTTPGTQGAPQQGQQGQQGPHAQHGRSGGHGMGHGQGRAGRMDNFLLQGITLTDAQRTQVQAIDEKYRPQM